MTSPTPNPRCRSSTAPHHGAEATRAVASSQSISTPASAGSAGSSVSSGTTRAWRMGVASAVTPPMIGTGRPSGNPAGPRATAPGV